MNNLLPKIKKKITNPPEDKNLSWRPADAHPKTGKVSSFLESEFTKVSSIKTVYGQNVLPMKPPNERFVESNIFEEKDESALRAALRDTADRPRLLFVPPPSLTRKTVIKDMSCGNCLILKMINTLPMCMDLFVQKKLTISTTTVFPMRQSVRLIAGVEDEKVKDDEACFWFCSSKRAVLTSTNRQELKDFTFTTKTQIGLEVEMVEDRLVVTDVLLGGQAAMFTLQLKESEVVAVNGTRIINMSEFREAMALAREGDGVLVIQVASYKGGKGKLDNLYAHDFTKSKEVKNLLSNIMLHGLDADHHRAITGDDDSVHEEEDSEDSEPEEPDTPHRRALEKKIEAITVEGWENLEEYPDIDVIIQDGAYDAVDEDGMMAKRRSPGPRPASRELGSPNRRFSMQGSHNGSRVVSRRSSLASINSQNSMESGDSWNKLTKVEEIVTRRSLVCYPADMGASLQWGVPSKHLQISNYSTTFTLEVCWVNEDGILVRRGDIQCGHTQYQMCDVDHVWVVIATPIHATSHHSQHNAFNFFTAGEALGLGTAAKAEEGSPAMVVFKPSKYSLSNNRCTSVLWTPFASMSITQRVYLSNKTTIEDSLSATKDAMKNPPHFTLTPHFHIQVFDGANKHGDLAGSNNYSMVKPLSREGAPLDRIKLSKWPKKGCAKREKALRALRK